MGHGVVSACQKPAPHWKVVGVAVVGVETVLGGNYPESVDWDIHLGEGSGFVGCLEPFLATCLGECAPFDSSCFLVVFSAPVLKLGQRNAEVGKGVGFEWAGD